MAYNLFIAYDLVSPGQNYDAIRDKIKSLGTYYQFQFSLFYVSTSLSPSEAYKQVIATMDSNDRLAVINAEGGIFSNWDNPPIDAINTIWNKL